jgi:hypothetical protein
VKELKNKNKMIYTIENKSDQSSIEFEVDGGEFSIGVELQSPSGPEYTSFFLKEDELLKIKEMIEQSIENKKINKAKKQLKNYSSKYENSYFKIKGVGCKYQYYFLSNFRLKGELIICDIKSFVGWYDEYDTSFKPQMTYDLKDQLFNESNFKDKQRVNGTEFQKIVSQHSLFQK